MFPESRPASLDEIIKMPNDEFKKLSVERLEMYNFDSTVLYVRTSGDGETHLATEFC